MARQLGISGAALRRLGVIYEGVHGDLPRDDRERLWSEEAVERVRAARQAVQAGQVQSVELALRQGVESAEALPARKQPAEMMEELLGELRGLREAVERQNALLEDQGRRLEALEAPQEPQDQAESARPGPIGVAPRSRRRPHSVPGGGGCSVVAERARTPPDELARMEFEFLKHLTTLSGAAILIVLAIYQELVVDRLSLSFALLFFALSALVAMWGMWFVCLRLSILSEREGEYKSLIGVLTAVYILFGGGVTSFLFNAVSPPWLLYVALALLSIALFIWNLGRVAPQYVGWVVAVPLPILVEVSVAIYVLMARSG